MRILVTAGATREPIDAVRFLSNVSTGATGAALADAFHVRGHQVTLLGGVGAIRPFRVEDWEQFSTAADLEARLRRRLAGGKYAVVVMGAAVADYRPRRMRPGKIRSDAARLTLELVRNEKILPQLKAFSPRPLRVIGFKLTAGASAAARRRAVNALFAAGGVDMVVHNDTVEIAGVRPHPFSLHGEAGDRGVKVRGVAALAAALEGLLAILERFEKISS